MLEVEVMRRINGAEEKASVTLEVLLCENGVYPKSISRHELDRSANEAFSTRNRQVVPDFFYKPASEAYPHDLSLVVVARDKENDRIVGGTITETYRIDDARGNSIWINYISKVWVLPEYEHNGLMNHLMKMTANSIKNEYPFALRTSEARLDAKYERWGDIGVEMPRYWIRGKGFLTKRGKERKSLPDGMYLFGIIAAHLNEKPASVIDSNRNLRVGPAAPPSSYECAAPEPRL